MTPRIFAVSNPMADAAKEALGVDTLQVVAEPDMPTENRLLNVKRPA